MIILYADPRAPKCAEFRKRVSRKGAPLEVLLSYNMDLDTPDEILRPLDLVEGAVFDRLFAQCYDWQLGLPATRLSSGKSVAEVMTYNTRYQSHGAWIWRPTPSIHIRRAVIETVLAALERQPTGDIVIFGHMLEQSWIVDLAARCVASRGRTLRPVVKLLGWRHRRAYADYLTTVEVDIAARRQAVADKTRARISKRHTAVAGRRDSLIARADKLNAIAQSISNNLPEALDALLVTQSELVQRLANLDRRQAALGSPTKLSLRDLSSYVEQQAALYNDFRMLNEQIRQIRHLQLLRAPLEMAAEKWVSSTQTGDYGTRIELFLANIANANEMAEDELAEQIEIGETLRLEGEIDILEQLVDEVDILPTGKAVALDLSQKIAALRVGLGQNAGCESRAELHENRCGAQEMLRTLRVNLRETEVRARVLLQIEGIRKDREILYKSADKVRSAGLKLDQATLDALNADLDRLLALTADDISDPVEMARIVKSVHNAMHLKLAKLKRALQRFENDQAYIKSGFAKYETAQKELVAALGHLERQVPNHPLLHETRTSQDNMPSSDMDAEALRMSLVRLSAVVRLVKLTTLSRVQARRLAYFGDISEPETADILANAERTELPNLHDVDDIRKDHKRLVALVNRIKARTATICQA